MTAARQFTYAVQAWIWSRIFVQELISIGSTDTRGSDLRCRRLTRCKSGLIPEMVGIDPAFLEGDRSGPSDRRLFEWNRQRVSKSFGRRRQVVSELGCTLGERWREH